MVCCFTDSDAGAQQLSQSSCLLGVVESFVLLVQSGKQLTRCWDVFDVRHAVSIPCLTVVCAVANLCCAVQIGAVRGNMNQTRDLKVNRARPKEWPPCRVPKLKEKPYETNRETTATRLLFWSFILWNLYFCWKGDPS